MSATSREKLAESEKNQAPVSEIEQNDGENPWKAFAGIWRQNPDFESPLKEIDNHRRETDEAQADQ